MNFEMVQQNPYSFSRETKNGIKPLDTSQQYLGQIYTNNVLSWSNDPRKHKVARTGLAILLPNTIMLT